MGSRIRLRRTFLGMSQERLGTALGLAAQQIQKYDKGENRVGASQLFELSRVLDVPVGFFYDRMSGVITVGETANSGSPDPTPGRSEPALADNVFSGSESHEMVQAYYRVTGRVTRARLLDLIRSLGPPEE